MPALHQQSFSVSESLWSYDSAATSPQLYSESSPSPTDSGSLFTITEKLEQYKPFQGSWNKSTPMSPLGAWRPHSTSSPVPSLDNQGMNFSLDSWYNRNPGFNIDVTQPFSPISPVGGPAPNAIRGYSPDNQSRFDGNQNQQAVFSPTTEQELANLRALHSLTWSGDESLDQSDTAANENRNQPAPLPTSEPVCNWCGVLPTMVEDEAILSSKVFLGGVPWDVSEETLVGVLSQFGKVKVEWPGKEHKASHQKGCAYIIFESEKQVKALLNSCPRKVSTKNGKKWYFRISSRKMKSKEVEVIPWPLSNSNYVLIPAQKLEPQTTVFVGALHGMLTAEGLFTVMNDLFGGVVYAGIDTDKFKYPIGSARVTFNNLNSYIRAVKAAFIEIKTPKFSKKVQVDPYLEDSPCSNCKFQQGPYFCREFSCFRYFCRSCWMVHELLTNHDYITRGTKHSHGQPTHMRFSNQ